MSRPLNVVLLSGGGGGARFTRGVLAALAESTGRWEAPSQVTVIANIGDDM